MRRWGVLVAAMVAASAGRAGAQGFDGERFVPAAGAAGGLVLERPVVPAHLGHGLGLFLNFADDAVVARERGSGATLAQPLDQALSADLLFALGLFDFAELAVHLPLRLVYAGDAFALDGGAIQAERGLGDVRFQAKVTFGWNGDTRGGSAFGLALPVSLPTGAPGALRGAGGATVEPRFLALVYGPSWFGTGNLGVRLREGEGASAPGNELTFGLGATLELPRIDELLHLQLEVVGAYLFGNDGETFSTLPLEALAALVYRPHPRWSFYGGAGVGLTNGLGAPDARVLAGVRYAVGVPGRGGQKDSDTDGVPDDEDRCPRDAEDLDGFADEDGCPEEDNDRDGILDDDDECPDDAEEPGGDRDGCPDRPTVVVRKGRLVVYGKVLFPVESATMRPQSERLIEEMARALKEHPELRRVEIGGHTDDTGRASYNQQLSQERAEAVKRALVARGVAAHRLVPKGYGEDQPLAPNVTRAGRAKNRRVEFTIL